MKIAEGMTPAEKSFTFLALLVASLPGEQDYTADASRWATAVLHLRKRYGPKYPHLFRYIHFRHAPRADSYSPEVSNFLAFLQFADGVTVQNPGFTKMRFQPTALNILRDRYKDLATGDDRLAIEEMSRDISGRIEANPEASTRSA
jgi:hypothetical protein